MDKINEVKSLKNTILGYACAVGVVVTMVIIVPCAQMLGNRIPQFETNFIYCIIQLFFSVLLLVVRCKNPRINCELIPIVVLCILSAVSFASGIFSIISSWYLPAAVVDGILENVIIILASIATIFIGHCNLVIPIAMFTSVAGNLLLFQPPFIFHYYDQTIPNGTRQTSYDSTELINISLCNETIMQNGTNFSNQITHRFNSEQQQHNSLLGFIYSVILGVLLWIIEQIIVPYIIKKRSLDVDIVFFWITVGCILPSTVAMYFDKQLIVPKNVHDIGLVIFLSLGLTAGTYLMMHSVVLITPIHTALILPLAVVMLFIAQKTILKEIQPGPSNWMEKVGLVMIVIASVLSPVFDLLQYRKSKRAQEDTPTEKTHLLPGS